LKFGVLAIIAHALGLHVRLHSDTYHCDRQELSIEARSMASQADAEDAQPSLLGLPTVLLQSALAHLPPADICSALRTCRALAGCDPWPLAYGTRWGGSGLAEPRANVGKLAYLLRDAVERCCCGAVRGRRRSGG
jgi:hypothetical protein